MSVTKGGERNVLFVPVRCFSSPIDDSWSGPTMSSSFLSSIETALMTPVSPTT